MAVRSARIARLLPSSSQHSRHPAWSKSLPFTTGTAPPSNAQKAASAAPASTAPVAAKPAAQPQAGTPGQPPQSSAQNLWPGVAAVGVVGIACGGIYIWRSAKSAPEDPVPAGKPASTSPDPAPKKAKSTKTKPEAATGAEKTRKEEAKAQPSTKETPASSVAPVAPVAPALSPEQLQAAAAAAAKAAEAACSSLASVDMSRKAAAERLGDALRTLKGANATRDLAAVEEALAAAHKAGLGVCAEVRFAQSIVEPARLVKDGLVEDLDEWLQLPKELRGLSEAEAAAAERAACEGMGKEQLQARVVELSRYLAMSRVHAKARIEEALRTRLEAAELASIRDLEDAVARARVEYDEDAAHELVRYEAELQKRHEEAVAAAAAAAVEAGQQRLAEEESRLRALAEEKLLEERCSQLPEILSLHRGLQAVERVLSQDEALVRQAHAYNGLAVAVLGLEDAIIAGRSAEAELEALCTAASKADAFTEHILAGLPASSLELCRRTDSVPTVPLLRRQLASELDGLAAAAFIPPGSGLLGELLGRAFRWLYVLRPEATPLPSPDGSATQAERNLVALGLAAPVPAGGDVPAEKLELALTRMEDTLGGLCRDRAASWLQEARSALVLRQTIWAVKARVQCLNAAFL